MYASNTRKPTPEDFVDKLKAARAGRSDQGERRVVTILFCDVVGSTAMAEQLDPEEWAEIMDDAYDFLIRPIYRYEGTVARLMGDAILAFFGAPTAHEDDPQRAVLAGLDILAGLQPYREQIRNEYGLDFNVRVGINTGGVVVGAIGSDLAGEYTAMGDAVNLAARMEQTAEPGSLQIAEDTYRLVAPLFEVEALGPVDVKGKQQDVQAYRVLGKKERPGRLRGIRGLMSPLVGRENQVAELRQAIRELQHGRGQILSLIGEAGLGKSRLIDELHAEWLLEHDSDPWFESRGISYESDRPYGLFQQHLRQVCGVREADPPSIVRQKILESMGDLSTEQRTSLQESIEILLATEKLADKPYLEGEAFKRQLFEAVLSIWRQVALQAPLVLAFDDLHWADQASIDLLIHIFQLAEEVPVLFLCAFRPYRHSAAWQVKQVAEVDYPHRYNELHLLPLTEEQSQALTSALLAVSELPGELHEMILKKAEGNPLFVEEVVRALIEDGRIVRDDSTGRWKSAGSIEELTIPDSLQFLMIARMDRLDTDVRQTLQIASVIGRSFHHKVLKSVSESNGNLDKHLNTLQRAELIREVTRVPEVEYAFLHELTRDAVYHSILRRNRRKYHKRVGEVIESLLPERTEREAHVLARHFEEARDFDKALHYYSMAGDAAARLYANKEAITQYSHALEIARSKSAPDEQLVYLYTRRGRVYEVCGQYDDALANYQELEALAKERGNPALELAALIPQTTIHAIPSARHDPAKGRSLSKRGLNLAQQLEDHQAEARVLWNLMLLSNFADRDYPRAVDYGERALAIARQHNLREELAYILNDITRVYREVGREDDSEAALEEAQKIWRESENLPMLADNLATMAEGLYMMGEYERALERAKEALQIGRSIHSLWAQAYSLSVLGPIYLEGGMVDQCIQSLREGLPLAEEANFGGGQIFFPVLLAWVFVYLGDPDTGIDVLSSLPDKTSVPTTGIKEYRKFLQAQVLLFQGEANRAAEALKPVEALFLQEGMDIYFGPLQISLIGEVSLANGDHQRTLELVEESIGRLKQTKTYLFLPDLLYLKGRALWRLGEQEEGYNVILDAYSEAKRQVSRRSIWQILCELARLDSGRGDQVKAEMWRREAREVIGFIAEHINDSELRASFLNLPQVREIFQMRGDSGKNK